MKTMQTQQHSEVLLHLGLDLITVSPTNELYRTKRDLSREALKDITESIKQDGVIQPILVMPDPDAPGRYRLIAGERRFQASKFAGKTDIPANIRNLSTRDALRLQLIENILREDVHFINVAIGYKTLLEEDSTMTTASLAAKIGKPESYIVQRLKLNDLTNEAKKACLSDKLNLGHALILSKLTPQAQKEAMENIKDYHGNSYGTVARLQQYVNQNVINDLATAPFDINDAELVKKAGACLMCPKRSGTAPLLFAEIKEKDRCVDRECYTAKCKKALVNKVKEIVETEPEIAFLQGYHEALPEIIEILESHNIKPLRESTDFNQYDKEGPKVKGLWISGSNTGKIVTLHLKKGSTKGSTTLDKKVQIASIQQRVKRAQELDQEKVYAKILEALKKHPTQKKDASKKLLADEEVFLWFVVLDKAGYQTKNELNKYLGIKEKATPEKVYSFLKNLKMEGKAFLLRKVMMDQYGGNYPDSNHGFIIRKIAEAYGDIDIDAFEKEQMEIRTKREARAKERIKDLQGK